MEKEKLKEKSVLDGPGKKKRGLLKALVAIVVVTVLLLVLKPWRLTANPYFKQFFGVITGEKLTKVSEEEAKKKERPKKPKKTTEVTGDDWWEEAMARPADPKGDPEKEIFILKTEPAHVEERPDTELDASAFRASILKLINDFRRYEGTSEVSTDGSLEAQAQQKSNEVAIRGAILNNYIKGVNNITYLGLAGGGVESMVVQENLNDTAYETYMNSRWSRIGIGATIGSFGGNKQVAWTIILAE